MQLEHYFAELLKEQLKAIFRKHLQGMHYKTFFFGSRVTGESKNISDIDIDIESALARFREVLLLPKNEVIRDSSIKRFEIVFELAWKVLKLFLEIQEGILVATPKSTFRETTVWYMPMTKYMQNEYIMKI